MLVLVAAAAPSLSAFVCDESSGFVRGVQYSQISLTDMCREAPRVCNANPKYGAPNGNARAIAWCEARCERDGASCTGFFFQQHRNGHEICGFYGDALESLRSSPWESASAHAAGAVCLKDAAAALTSTTSSTTPPLQSTTASTTSTALERCVRVLPRKAQVSGGEVLEAVS